MILINYKEGLHLWCDMFRKSVEILIYTFYRPCAKYGLLLAIFSADSFWSCSSRLNFNSIFSNTTRKKHGLWKIDYEINFFPHKLILTFDMIDGNDCMKIEHWTHWIWFSSLQLKCWMIFCFFVVYLICWYVWYSMRWMYAKKDITESADETNTLPHKSVYDWSDIIVRWWMQKMQI